MKKCQICKRLLKYITASHLKKHNITVEEYRKEYNVRHLQCKSMRKEISERNIGNDYGIGNKSRTGLFGHKCTEENKEKSRIRMNEMYEDGTLKPGMSGYCKMYPVENYIGEEVKVQGKPELRFAELLNKLRVRWIRPKPKTYVLDDKEHKYFCDFYLPDYRMYVEVKSRYVYNNSREEVKAKKQMMMRRGERKGFRYKIMFEKNIKEFELNVAEKIKGGRKCLRDFC